MGKRDSIAHIRRSEDGSCTYFAHSANDDGEWHRLKEHLFGTANRMREFACNGEYAKLFWQTGLAHDLGKYQAEFQDYLINGGKRGSVPHAVWGAGFARRLQQVEMAFAIDGHHKGLPDKAELQSIRKSTKGKSILSIQQSKKYSCLIWIKPNWTLSQHDLNYKNWIENFWFVTYSAH